MKNNTRKVVTLIEEFDAITLLKPFSGEYEKFLVVIREDAYGEFSGKLEPITEIRKKFSLSDEEFDKILKDLGI